MTFIKTKCPNCGVINEANKENFEAGCYSCKEFFNIKTHNLVPFSEKEKENEVVETLTSFIEQVQVKMIIDVDYYNNVVEKLAKKGLLPKYDKLEQAKKEALKILKIKQ